MVYGVGGGGGGGGAGVGGGGILPSISYNLLPLVLRGSIFQLMRILYGCINRSLQRSPATFNSHLKAFFHFLALSSMIEDAIDAICTPAFLVCLHQ